MNLQEMLKAAVADPPPPDIDLDALARRERHRRHVVRWASFGGGTALVLAVAVAAVPLLGSRAGLPTPGIGPELVVPTVQSTPRLRASETPQQAAVAAHLTTVLQSLGPDLGVGPEVSFVVEQGEWGAAPDGHWYAARWNFDGVQLAVIVRRAMIPLEDACAKNGAGLSCRRIEERDGSVSYFAEDVDGGTRQAENYRPDNVALMVTATGPAVFNEETLLTVTRLDGWSLTG
ncbi:hypothetical protein ACFQZ4_32940 [Catellatospora coxensis]|uniref:Uncharacterized protein n=1 Tax=Catellatospora coxensis TaxID=310354 RepID=A0A8J3L257_9ACTN|nr:hypothetical protein [Catellatospora coxensis]GIG06340.1 hypothetical protein Cco03nite_30400 [Catellatospora coxensis]